MFRIWMRFWSGEKNEYEKYFKRVRKQKTSSPQMTLNGFFAVTVQQG